MIASVALVALLASSAALAESVTLAGFVDDGDAPADDLFTFTFALLDEADAVLWQEEQPNVIVAAGSFAIDLGAATPLPDSVPATARLRVGIDDDELLLVPLARLAHVRHAQRAAEASAAPTTSRLQGLTRAELATRAALAQSGGTSVAFVNLTGVPPDLANGDNGAVVTAREAACRSGRPGSSRCPWSPVTASPTAPSRAPTSLRVR